MSKSYILSIDQGTSSTKTIIFNEAGQAEARASAPLKTHYSEGGFVEQDPEDIYQNVLTSVRKCLEDFKRKGGDVNDIRVCGISNQRETFVVWDEKGKPFHNAVVWQCKRSVQICEKLKAADLEETIKQKTGLIIDPYFSGTKLMWLNENVPALKEAVRNGKAYFGTIDTWLLYRLTKGKSYYTDYTNASRTLFFNLFTLSWDQDLLKVFELEGLHLPETQASSATYGASDFEGMFPHAVTIGGMIGDSHAAAFGEGCFEPGTAKATLGTGCSIIMNIGDKPTLSKTGMVTTVCWSVDGRIDYALEGVIVTCGATIEWLKNELGILAESKDSESMANAVADNNGVYIVPAFSGLGAPYWQMNRKASITGLTFDCNKNHLVRAALESIPYQIKDVIIAMESDTSIKLKELMVNGGITANQFVMQFLADLLARPISSIGIPDVSALGAAYLAGLQSGIYKNLDHLKELNSHVSLNKTGARIKDTERYYSGWKNAIGVL